jgi:hypothetical protein
MARKAALGRSTRRTVGKTGPRVSPTQRSRSVRSVRAATAPANELDRLRETLGALDGAIRRLGAPIQTVKTTIEALSAPLKLPPRIIQALTDTHTALSAMRIATTGLSWVPGPIGTGARAADKAIKPFVAAPPAPHGILRNARDITAEIDRGLKPVREAIERIEGPVNKAAGAFDAIEARLAHLIIATDRLVAHYGLSPPPGIEACAAQLNTPLHAALVAITRLEAEAGKALGTLAQTLEGLLAGLRPLTDAAASLEQALAALAAKPIRDMLSVLRKLVSALEPYRRWAEVLLKRILTELLKRFGISLAAIDRFFDRLINAVNPLKPLATILASAKARLAALGEKLLAAIGVADLLAQLEDLQRRAEQEIDAFLQSACGGKFMAQTLPARG